MSERDANLERLRELLTVLHGDGTCSSEGAADIAALAYIIAHIESEPARVAAAVEEMRELVNKEAWQMISTRSSLSVALFQAAKDLLDLMDEVQIDVSLGDETDRVFSRREFGPLRQAIDRIRQLDALPVEPSGNPCPVSFPHPPHDYCDGKPGARPFGEPSGETPAKVTRCLKCGQIAGARGFDSGGRPASKYCGDGSDKENEHRWEVVTDA